HVIAARRLLQRLVQQVGILGLLRRLEQQGRVGGGIHRLEGPNGIDVAGISDDQGVLAKTVEFAGHDGPELLSVNELRPYRNDVTTSNAGIPSVSCRRAYGSPYRFKRGRQPIALTRRSPDHGAIGAQRAPGCRLRLASHPPSHIHTTSSKEPHGFSRRGILVLKRPPEMPAPRHPLGSKEKTTN